MIEVCSPFKPDTTVGRLLEKRGDGGYMIIMQTADATARRSHIESNNLAKVIFGYSHEDAVSVQYHPKGIAGRVHCLIHMILHETDQHAGGMMPELDSHARSATNPTPLESPYSPWHACGPDYPQYSAAMRRRSHLRLLGVTLRLSPGRSDTDAAAQQWQDYFGVEKNGSALQFTNTTLKFVPGVEGLAEGLESITIGVKGRDRYRRVLDLVSREGLHGDGFANMLGIKWYFILEDEHGQERSSKSGNQSKI